MAKWRAEQIDQVARLRAEQPARVAEDRALASKEIVDAVAASTKVVLVESGGRAAEVAADRSERIAEIAEDVRGSLVEKAEATRGVVVEKAEDAVDYWQDTGRAKAEQAAKVAAERGVKVMEETAKASLQLGGVVAANTKTALVEGGGRAAEIAAGSDLGSAAKTLSPKHHMQTVRSNAEASVRAEMGEQMAAERRQLLEAGREAQAKFDAERSELMDLARTKSKEKHDAVAAAAAAGGAAPTVIWECNVDGAWHPYSDQVQHALESGFHKRSRGSPTFKDRGHDYTADLDAMKQVNVATGVKRSIRRRLERPVAHSAIPDTWTPQPAGQNCSLVRVGKYTSSLPLLVIAAPFLTDCSGLQPKGRQSMTMSSRT
jgi:hypothetical protein